MSESNYRPTGQLQGDSKPMPDRGTGTGFGSNAQTMGAGTGQDDTNSQGGISGSTCSDPAEQGKAKAKPRA